MRLEIPKKYKSFKDYYTIARDKNLLFDYDASFGDYATYSDHVLSQTRFDEMLEYIIMSFGQIVNFNLTCHI